MQDEIIRIEHVSKYYPGVVALNDVSFTIGKGEVRALVGENGAGKSTLIKCIMGVETPDEGKIELNYDGAWIVNRTALEAQNHGVHANYQSVTISPELSVAENYYLGHQPKKGMIVDWPKMHKESRKIIDKFDLDIDPSARIRDLSVAMQAMVTISKISVNDDIRVVIFDEPTALLENEKVETLFKYIRELKEEGVSVIYISHRLEEITEICDSVTILKDGTYVDTRPISEVTKDSLIHMMVGREMTDIYNIDHQPPGEELVRVEDFSGSASFRNINFSLHAGEILGFFGLVGAGRSEIMRGLSGVDPVSSGRVFIHGKETRIKNVSDALKNGIGFLTEDRRTDGVALQLSINRNINMSSLDMISRAGFISLPKERERSLDFVERVNIKTPTIEQHVENLSGGNQQKVVIAKLLCREPDILIFDEPTVGVDVGAKQEIYKIMESLTSQGKGIILISSYLPEVMGLADRLIVMAQGDQIKEFGKEELKDLTEEDVLKYASLGN